jgi:hypothetical protein
MVAWDCCFGRLHGQGLLSLGGKRGACSRDDHSRRRSRIGCVKQSNTERPSWDPSGIGIVELGEDVAGVVAAVFCNGKDANDNGKHTSKGPENGKSLLGISNTYSRLWKGSHIKPRQPSISKSGDSVAKECNGKEDKIDLPVFTSKDTNTGLGFEDVDAGTKEKRSGEVDGKGDGDVSDYKSPATNPRCDSAIGRW